MASLVALDLSRTGIRAVELSNAYSAHPTVTKFASVAAPEGAVFDGEAADPARLTTALTALRKGAGFSTKKVAIGFGNRKVVAREATLPPLDEATRRTALRYQVQGMLPLPLDEAILDFLPLHTVNGDAGPAQEGLLVAAAKAGVESTVAAVEKAGFHVDSIDMSTLALVRSLGWVAGPKTAAIIEVGASSTNVVIVNNGIPEFVRILPTGGDDITRALERALGTSFTEADSLKMRKGLRSGAADNAEAQAETIIREHVAALIDAVRNTLAYYAGAHPGQVVTRIVLGGGGSRLEGLGVVLSRALSVEVVPADPFGAVGVSKAADKMGIRGLAPELSSTLGLAIGAKR